jgi:ribosomal protein L31
MVILCSISDIDFIHPGAILPPLADPQLFFRLTCTHIEGKRPREWQTMVLLGDTTWHFCLVRLFERLKVPGSLKATVFHVLKSNAYEIRLFKCFSLHKYLLGPSKKDVGQVFVGKPAADAWEVRLLVCNFLTQVYVQSLMYDALYAFTDDLAENYVCRFLEHILLPLLDYLSHVYYHPICLPRILHNVVAFKNEHIRRTDEKGDLLNLQPRLKELLKHVLDGGTPPTCKITKVTLTVDVPVNSNHPFWTGKMGQSSTEGSKRSRMHPVVVFAFACSADDAYQIALLRLNSFLNDCRHRIFPVPSCEKSFDNTGIFSIQPRDPVIEVGRGLMDYYGVNKRGLFLSDEIQENLWNSLEEILHKNGVGNQDLLSLMKYYLVLPVLDLELIRQNLIIARNGLLRPVKYSSTCRTSKDHRKDFYNGSSRCVGRMHFGS